MNSLHIDFKTFGKQIIICAHALTCFLCHAPLPFPLYEEVAKTLQENKVHGLKPSV